MIRKLAQSALRWMAGEAQSGLLSFHLATEPVPASRPNVTRWGVYYGKNYNKFRTAAVPLANGYEGPALPEGPLVVMLEHVVTKPRTSRKLWPRGDVDNFDKGPLDAFTKSEKFWTDDDQVVGLIAFKRFAEVDETPGVYASWFQLTE